MIKNDIIKNICLIFKELIMLKKLSFLFLLLLFIAPAFSEDTKEDKTRGFQITEEEKNLPEWSDYMYNLELQIRSNWTPPVNCTSKNAVVLFTIAHNGELISSKIGKSSNSKDFDEKALDIIQKLAPFEPLPEKYKGESIVIDYTFSCNLNYGN